MFKIIMLSLFFLISIPVVCSDTLQTLQASKSSNKKDVSALLLHVVHTDCDPALRHNGASMYPHITNRYDVELQKRKINQGFLPVSDYAKTRFAAIIVQKFINYRHVGLNYFQSFATLEKIHPLSVEKTIKIIEIKFYNIAMAQSRARAVTLALQEQSKLVTMDRPSSIASEIVKADDQHIGHKRSVAITDF